MSENDLSFSQKWINLAEERYGTKVLFATDDFFAEKENLIKPGRGVFIADKFTERGKWMDGWESRRKRTEGHDFCIIQLGLQGIIRGVDIDTNHFTGNHPEAASLEACNCSHEPNDQTEWKKILSSTQLNPGSQHLFEINDENNYTHIRLNIFPDGGVARLRIYGDVKRNWDKIKHQEVLDYALINNEGKAISCSDMYFSHKDNINAPNRGVNMADGWETKRRRGPGNDWIVLALGKKIQVDHVVVDTAHFKGNFPESCQIETLCLEVGQISIPADSKWDELLPNQKLSAHKEHLYKSELQPAGAITHIRLNIYPDGGISRIRVFGVQA